MVGDAVRKMMRGEVGQELVDHDKDLGKAIGEFGTEAFLASMLKVG